MAMRKPNRKGSYIVRDGSTHPSPVIPNLTPSPSPPPTEVDRRNARRFLELKAER